jgi:hydrogenase nickel insertion protein HypA
LRDGVHEYSLVQALLARVEREARARDAVGVHRVTVLLGRMGGVEPELFATAFEQGRIGTLCERAALELKTEDVRWECGNCGREIPPGQSLVCPACAFPARMTGGDALVLERLELEVNDDV